MKTELVRMPSWTRHSDADSSNCWLQSVKRLLVCLAKWCVTSVSIKIASPQTQFKQSFHTFIQIKQKCFIHVVCQFCTKHKKALRKLLYKSKDLLTQQPGSREASCQSAVLNSYRGKLLQHCHTGCHYTQHRSLSTPKLHFKHALSFRTKKGGWLTSM